MIAGAARVDRVARRVGAARRTCLRLTRPYLAILTWSLPPLLLYVAFRRYLQGLGIVRPVMVALIVANLVNAVANWMLIYGHLGAPAMGVRGSAWATLAARVFMAAWLFVVVLRADGDREPRLRDTSFGLDLARQRRLFALGLPAAGQAVLEVGVFAAATALAGARVGPRAGGAPNRAEHGGVHVHGAVRPRVGRRGAGRSCRWSPGSPGVASAGWTAIGIGVTFMTTAAIVFLALPGAVDPRVHRRPGRRCVPASRSCSSPRSSSCSTVCKG